MRNANIFMEHKYLAVTGRILLDKKRNEDIRTELEIFNQIKYLIDKLIKKYHI